MMLRKTLVLFLATFSTCAVLSAGTTSVKGVEDRYTQFLAKKHGVESLPYALNKGALHVFKEKGQSVESAIANWQALGDMEVVVGENDPERSVANSLKKTRLIVGDVALMQQLVSPLDGVQALIDRQAVVKRFYEDDELYDEWQKRLAFMQERESETLDFFVYSLEREERWKSIITPYIPEAYARKNAIFPQLVRELNWKSAELSARFGDALSAPHLSLPALLAVLAGGTIGAAFTCNMATANEKGKEAREFMKRLRGLFAAIPGGVRALTPLVKNSSLEAKLGAGAGALLTAGLIYGFVVSFRNRRNLFYKLQDKMRQVGEFFDGARDLIMFAQNNPDVAAQIPEFEKVRYLIDEDAEGPQAVRDLMALLDSDAVRSEESHRYFTTATGKIIAAYNMMGTHKAKLAPVMRFVGRFDALMSVATLLRESKDKKNPYVLCSYVEADAPVVELQQFWNPLFDPEIAVANDFALGGNRKEKNGIFSGVNAGGKSSSLRGIAINILLAQTLCISASQSMTFTPFSKMVTLLTISDDAAAGRSRYKMEAVRTIDLVNTINDLKGTGFAFSIMDELFSGTSNKEGSAAAYSTALHLNSLSNNMFLLATHHELLKKLEVHTGGQIKNFMVRAKVNPIDYDYRLVPGFSDQNIAIDILKEDGIDSAIFKYAQDILDNPGKYEQDKKIH